MNILGATSNQTVIVVLLGVLLALFFIADIYLVLFLRHKNQRLAKKPKADEQSDSLAYEDEQSQDEK